jgi:hypothetical protein
MDTTRKRSTLRSLALLALTVLVLFGLWWNWPESIHRGSGGIGSVSFGFGEAIVQTAIGVVVVPVILGIRAYRMRHREGTRPPR